MWECIGFKSKACRSLGIISLREHLEYAGCCSQIKPNPQLLAPGLQYRCRNFYEYKQKLKTQHFKTPADPRIYALATRTQPDEVLGSRSDYTARSSESNCSGNTPTQVKANAVPQLRIPDKLNSTVLPPFEKLESLSCISLRATKPQT